jgi:hypothetical protein
MASGRVNQANLIRRKALPVRMSGPESGRSVVLSRGMCIFSFLNVTFWLQEAKGGQGRVFCHGFRKYFES